MSRAKNDFVSKSIKKSLSEKPRRLRKNRPSDDDYETDDDDIFDEDEDYEDEDDDYETIDEEEDDDDEDDDDEDDEEEVVVKKKRSRHIVMSEDEEDEDAESIAQYISKHFPYTKPSRKKYQKHVDVYEDEDEDDSEEDTSVDVRSKHKHKRYVTRSQTKKKDKKSKKEKRHKKTRDNTKKSSKNKRKYVDESETDTEEEYEDEDFDDEDGDNNKVNIIFSLGKGDAEDYDAYFGGHDDDEELLENDDEDVGSDDEKTYMRENYQEIVLPKSDDDEEKEKGKSKKDKKNDKNKKKTNKTEEDTASDVMDIEEEYLELLDLKKHLTAKLLKKPKSRMLRKAINECKESINKLIKTTRMKNTKHYHKLIHGAKKQTNEMDYFKKKLSNKEQLKIMNELKEINEHIHIEKPYRLSILQSKMPPRFKAVAMQKLNALKSMEPSDPEYHKIKNWVDNFMKIPFGVYKNLSVTMEDGPEVCNEFLENAQKTLDECSYGLDDAKIQVMQMLGQWISNPSAMGTSIAIKGPPGTAKTTLIKEGISKILGREFVFIALGGAGDGSFLEGHSYTYEGSTWGRIVQILIDSKCMNPVIYFDELDKISDTPRGQEIVGILTHLTDTTQNSQFHDKYFSEIDFDLSKCLFIFSYNDENLVNPILKDRMYRIQTKGYDAKEKTVIARNYLLPKIREQVNFKEEDIIVPDDTIQYIISTQGFTKNEDGVRNLKRCLEIIYTKLNLFRLVKQDNHIFAKKIDIKVEFPFTVTRKHADVLLKNDENQNQSLLAMYV
jgi:ATP-dependent Lon protease